MTLEKQRKKKEKKKKKEMCCGERGKKKRTSKWRMLCTLHNLRIFWSLSSAFYLLSNFLPNLRRWPSGELGKKTVQPYHFPPYFLLKPNTNFSFSFHFSLFFFSILPKIYSTKRTLRALDNISFQESFDGKYKKAVQKINYFFLFS